MLCSMQKHGLAATLAIRHSSTWQKTKTQQIGVLRQSRPEEEMANPKIRRNHAVQHAKTWHRPAACTLQHLISAKQNPHRIGVLRLFGEEMTFTKTQRNSVAQRPPTLPCSWKSRPSTRQNKNPNKNWACCGEEEMVEAETRCNHAAQHAKTWHTCRTRTLGYLDSEKRKPV